jgi:CheY-like chemotaxis protein/DNA-directed RNA polymerase subunit RPC12/RpoP
MADPDKAYCISCGEEVALEKVNLGIDGEDLYRCAQCGAYLGTAQSVEQLAQTLENAEVQNPPPQFQEHIPIPEGFDPETSLLSSGPIPEVPKGMAPAGEFQPAAEQEVFTQDERPAQELPKMETIIIAEDSELVRTILKEMIVRKGLSRRVISCNNGFEFIISYLENRANKVPIGLAILDVVMPVLNGISAAVAARAWEKALGAQPVPFLYFTSKRCDDTFKRVIQHTRPSMYINKGASDTAAQLELRIEKLIKQLLKENF